MARYLVLTSCLVQLLVCVCVCSSEMGRVRGPDGCTRPWPGRPAPKEPDFGTIWDPFRTRGKRSIEHETSDAIHRELFILLDSNKDGQLDEEEWNGEGAKVLSFASLIVDHDQDKDGKISLAEFQQTRILDRLDSSQSNDNDE